MEAEVRPPAEIQTVEIKHNTYISVKFYQDKKRKKKSLSIAVMM